MKMISNKKRNTVQKRFVVDYLTSHYDHPTAEAIYLARQKEGLRLGLTTVYRILEGLRQEGLLVVIISKDEVHYDWIRMIIITSFATNAGRSLILKRTKTSSIRSPSDTTSLFSLCKGS
jgi:hypothetical protein